MLETAKAAKAKTDASLPSQRLTWADSQGIPKLVFGQTLNGIEIIKDNRVSRWEKKKAGIQTLYDNWNKNYKAKGNYGVLCGVWHHGVLKYAIFAKVSHYDYSFGF